LRLRAKLDGERSWREHLRFTVEYNRKLREANQPGKSGPPKGGTPKRPAEAPADPEPVHRRNLSPSRAKAAAVYEWAMATIAEADKMTVQELFTAILDRLDATIAAAPPGAGELEKLQELRESLPRNAESFAKYLRDAGIKRYNAKGERTRRTSHFRPRDQL
jgi:hypothetical protein